MVQMDSLVKAAKDLAAEIHQRITRQTVRTELLEEKLERVTTDLGNSLKILQATALKESQLRDQEMVKAKEERTFLRNRVIALEGAHSKVLKMLEAHTASRVEDLRAIHKRLETLTQEDAVK